MTVFVASTAARANTPAAESSRSGGSARRAPSLATLPPAMGNGSSLAATSIAQTRSYTESLRKALATSTAAYEKLVNRGLLTDAVSYSEYASSIIKADQNADNDAFKDVIEASITNVLRGVQELGSRPIDFELVLTDLTLARNAAFNVEKHLDSPTQQVTTR